jgi:UDP-N-acetylmuramate--alanine ligase
MRPEGTLIVGKELAPLFADYTGRLWTVSLKPPADILAVNIRPHEKGLGASYDVVFHGENLGTLDLYVPGHHLIYDSLCAVGAALADGIPFDTIREGLAAYRSTKKRFEYKGSIGDVMVIDDYAHHPSEIRATLEAAREVPHRELYVVFQPHTYSRTKSFLPDFITALSTVDHVVLADIYAAREADPGDIHSMDIVRGLQEKGVDCHYFPTFDEIENFLLENLSPGDMLITMGAGDVVSIGESLLGIK